MPRIICLYVNLVDWLCIKIGRLTMYMVFVMMFVLVLSFVFVGDGLRDSADPYKVLKK